MQVAGNSCLRPPEAGGGVGGLTGSGLVRRYMSIFDICLCLNVQAGVDLDRTSVLVLRQRLV